MASILKRNKVQLLMDLREIFNAKLKQRVEIRFCCRIIFSCARSNGQDKTEPSGSRRCELPLMRSVCDKTGKIT